MPRWARLAVVLLTAFILTGSGNAGAETSHLAFSPNLARFFSALAALDRHHARLPVRIIQIGDSHTANDAFSGRLRQRFQQRFGDAGRGWLPAGIPYKYYRPAQVQVTASGWQPVALHDAAAALPLGLDAVAAESTAAGARLTLESTEPAGFDHFAVEFLARPDSSPLAVRIDGRPAVPIVTTGASPQPRQVAIATPPGAHHIVLTAQDRRPAILLGWGIEQRRPGVIYENHGTIGATVALLDRIDPATVAFELAHRRPALIIVAFGTNEGFDDALDPQRYATRFATAVAALQHRAPAAAILVLGPPDGNRVDHTCMPAAAQPCTPGTAAACAWHEPRHLAAVRQAQIQAAATHRWAFWDWSAAMGGICSIDRLFTHDPPLAMPDHVHPNTAGYEAMADTLFSDLMQAYDHWQAEQRRRR